MTCEELSRRVIAGTFRQRHYWRPERTKWERYRLRCEIASYRYLTRRPSKRGRP